MLRRWKTSIAQLNFFINTTICEIPKCENTNYNGKDDASIDDSPYLEVKEKYVEKMATTVSIALN